MAVNETASVSTRVSGSYNIIDVNVASITPSVAIDLRQAVLNLINKNCLKIAINLLKVNFIDSTGLGVLISSQKTCSLRGGRLTIFGLQEQVERLVAMTRLDKALYIYPNENEAINS